MEILFEQSRGLDVHKKTVVACLVTPADAGRVRQELRTFGTMTNRMALRPRLTTGLPCFTGERLRAAVGLRSQSPLHDIEISGDKLWLLSPCFVQSRCPAE